jgi:hypothetical protein
LLVRLRPRRACRPFWPRRPRWGCRHVPSALGRGDRPGSPLPSTLLVGGGVPAVRPALSHSAGASRSHSNAINLRIMLRIPENGARQLFTRWIALHKRFRRVCWFESCSCKNLPRQPIKHVCGLHPVLCLHVRLRFCAGCLQHCVAVSDCLPLPGGRGTAKHRGLPAVHTMSTAQAQEGGRAASRPVGAAHVKRRRDHTQGHCQGRHHSYVGERCDTQGRALPRGHRASSKHCRAALGA